VRRDGPPLDLANAIRGFAVLKDKAGETHEAQRLWQEAHRICLSVNATAAIVESAAGSPSWPVTTAIFNERR
jgi:hypothetical protein